MKSPLKMENIVKVICKSPSIQNGYQKCNLYSINEKVFCQKTLSKLPNSKVTTTSLTRLKQQQKCARKLEKNSTTKIH